ncbi:hypothetical protein L6452_36528 [Arctium lappa]|uniref:Uncharacterized protein n=1 Tax=Arctium lappa TaxID=4217 RepID=A0ACB8Y9L5_ARCLA|nr:hypothetical protein L6452_36528 [Arctium lappa]
MAQSSIVASKHVRFAITEVEITKCNHLGRLDFKADKYPHLVEAAEFLKQSCIAYAITVDPKPSKTLLQQFWFTADATELTNKKGERVPAISFSTDLGPGSMTALNLRKSLRFPDKPKSGFDALPTDAELISFLDAMGYCWEKEIEIFYSQQKAHQDSQSSDAFTTELHLLAHNSVHEREEWFAGSSQQNTTANGLLSYRWSKL